MRTKSLLFFSITALASSLSAFAADTVHSLPFSYTFDDEESFYEEWTNKAGQNAQTDDGWEFDSWGACVSFTSEEKKQDNWLISQAIYFPEAGTYRITTVVDISYDILEVALGTNSSSLSSFSQVLQTLTDKNYYFDTNTTDFEITEPGTYYLGFHACSESGDWFGISLYSVSILQPGASISPKELPYTFDFHNSVLFDLEWTSIAGPDAGSQKSWSYDDWGNYAAFEVAKREDNWLISPPLAMNKAGKYSLSTIVEANGKVEVCVGTDPTDPSSFNLLITTYEKTGSTYNDPEKFEFDIETPGTYYIGFHACAEMGDDWYGEYVAYLAVQLEKASSVSNIESYSLPLSYSNGILKTRVPADYIKVFSLDGSLLTSVANSDHLSLSDFGHELVIVVANIKGESHTLKVRL